MGIIVYLDTVLIPFSLFLMVGYHAYLWHSFKNKPSQTTIGINALRRKGWFLDIKEGDDKKGMLAVQSLRNAQMATIFTASVAILINLSVAALTNNTYISSHLLSNPFFGLQVGRISVLKFGSASLFLLVSFLCSSMALGFLVEANFLLNIFDDFSSSPTYVQTVFERGFLLSLIGNRVLCITFPLLIWLLGPVPVALSSVALVWGLYELDFYGKCGRETCINSLT
ncbi:hypothetical protein P3X46_005128 [Hevea brasiliensis]|uniref:DUF599 domain-containing protein n=1 Tax=Hevea brasiliensis TaxID=3981 RepID=A0ABQ9N2G2_HEVBR|nr:uncharacterized protein LOC110668717 [Hevea brasiliensis]KAJ9185498.1 hypothetical protein P3X46_005128 [Hevea brasiliensis]